MKSPVAVAASQPAHRPTESLSMAWGASSRSLMLLWGCSLLLSSCTLCCPRDRSRGWGWQQGSWPFSVRAVHFNSLLRTGCSYTPPQSRGQAWAVLKPGRQFCSSRQQKSGSIALALPHLPSCTQPDWCSCTRAPCHDTAQPPQPPSEAWHCTEETSAFVALPSQVPKEPSLAPCVSKILPAYPSTAQLPSASTAPGQHTRPWHCSPHTPKSSSLQDGEVPLKAASSAPPPPQCPWQRHTGDRKDTLGTWRMLLSRGMSAQQGEAEMSLLGDGYQQPLGQVLCHT